MLNIRRFVFNMLEENTYLLWDDAREAVIVDCGARRDDECRQLADFIARNGLTVCRLLQTHAHFDHLFGADFIDRTYGVRPTIARAEAETYAQAAEQMRVFMHRDLGLTLPAPAALLEPDDVVRVGHHELRVVPTPGHTPGGVCYYCAEASALLSGDSLFRGSIGRCDFPGGCEADLVGALRDRVLTLPDSTTILPGHGEATTVADERANNPWLR